MMEFFLSKVWAFLLAAVIIASLLEGLHHLDNEKVDGTIQGIADDLVEIFERCQGMDRGSSYFLELSEVLPRDATLTITRDIMIIENGDQRIVTGLMSSITLFEEQGSDAKIIDSLTFNIGDRMRIESCGDLMIKRIGP